MQRLFRRHPIRFAWLLVWIYMNSPLLAQAEGNGLSPLGQTINQCDLIAMKAAADLPEALPFQRLEKAARQAHVVERCMQDRGYQENPAWVTQANVAAAKLAKQQQISTSEAYETMRRQAMLKEAPAGKPSYWRKRAA